MTASYRYDANTTSGKVTRKCTRKECSMSRPKSSDWHPVGLEGANVDDLYTDELLNNIIERHLRVFNEEKKAELRRRLRNIAGLIKLERHYRRRPTEGSKRKALNDVRRALEGYAKELVGSLDSDSRRMIEAEAGKRQEARRRRISRVRVGRRALRTWCAGTSAIRSQWSVVSRF